MAKERKTRSELEDAVMREARASGLSAALLVVTTAMTTGTALADATWFCAVEGSIRKYQVVEKELTDLTEVAFFKRWGLDLTWDKYQVLKDTPEGIVAAQSRTAKSGDDSASVSVAIILINKQTGAMRRLFLSTEDSERDTSVRGHCEPG